MKGQNYMRIIEYFTTENKEYWLNEIEKSDWGAGQYLYQLLRDNRLKSMVGETALVLMLADGDKLISFCTFAPLDDIQPTDLSPWIGFVYTFPQYRGHRYLGLLLDHAESIAASRGKEYIYISTGHTGLYEKYGYEFFKMDKDIEGEDSRVYRKALAERGIIFDIADGTHYIAQVKELIDEYTTALGRNLDFQGIEDELSDPAKKYAAPDGKILIAFENDAACGMVACHKYSAGCCEMKRLYVKPEYRGRHLGEQLVRQIIEEAKKEGYQEMVLDTLKPMRAAIALYKKYGFKECAPYYFNPMSDVIYMKRNLGKLLH